MNEIYNSINKKLENDKDCSAIEKLTVISELQKIINKNYEVMRSVGTFLRNLERAVDIKDELPIKYFVSQKTYDAIQKRKNKYIIETGLRKRPLSRTADNLYINDIGKLLSPMGNIMVDILKLPDSEYSLMYIYFQVLSTPTSCGQDNICWNYEIYRRSKCIDNSFDLTDNYCKIFCIIPKYAVDLFQERFTYFSYIKLPESYPNKNICDEYNNLHSMYQSFKWDALVHKNDY